MYKYLFLLCFSFISLFGSKITSNHIPEELVTAIMMNECLIEGEYCNPYIIGLNRKKDIKKAKKNGFNVKKRRIIYCYNENTCVDYVKNLNKIGINNLDLGPFQINTKYHKLSSLYDYFNYEKSRNSVKKILATLINRHGYSWYTIGRYHSGTKKLNQKYCSKLFKTMKKIRDN